MKRIVILLAALALVAFAGCGGPKGGGAESTIVYGTTEKVSDMDTANAYDFHTWEIFQNIDQGLLAYKAGGTEIVPGLATGYKVNDKGDEYTFTLREGLKFSDGTVFDASVVKWSIDRVLALKGDPSWLVADFVVSVEAKDAKTVVFKLKQPCGFFPALVATPTYFPLNPNDYPADKVVKDISELKSKTISGLGAYKLTSFKRDEEAVLDANPDYYGSAPQVKRIVIRYFKDATTLRLALEKGEIDLAYKQLNPSDIKDLSAKGGVVANRIPGAQIRYLCFETSEGVFKDKALRQAVAALVDRPDILSKVYLGQNAPLYSMIPAGMIYHAESFKLASGETDVAKATELLAKAGYTAAKPLSFEFWYTPSHYGDTEVNMAEVLKAQLEKCPALKVTLKSAEWATYKENWNKKLMPVFLLGWYPDYIDPDNYTDAFAGTTGSAGNGIYFSSPEWDALFAKEKSATADAERAAVFAKVQDMWTVDVPTVPLWQGELFVFTKPGISGVKIGPTLIFNYAELRKESK